MDIGRCHRAGNLGGFVGFIAFDITKGKKQDQPWQPRSEMPGGCSIGRRNAAQKRERSWDAGTDSTETMHWVTVAAQRPFLFPSPGTAIPGTVRPEILSWCGTDTDK